MPRPTTLFHRLIATALAALVGLTPAMACQEEAMLVFDASGSMSIARDGFPKIDIAREAAAEVLPELTRSRPTGLVTYGGEQGEGCTGVSLRFPPMTDSADLIIGELTSIVPSGSTPLTEAVWLAALTLKNAGKPGTVVLVTDGRENCGYDACAAGRHIAQTMKTIKVHVIGFYLHAVAESNVACMASTTGGTYTSVNSLEDLKKALMKTLACPRIS
jgi:Ca-activated chloride channel family protein